METHPDPAKALSDGPNAWPLGLMRPLLEVLKRVDDLIKAQPLAERSCLPSLART
jgi:2-dehydro-3-deoxyphosphooctonate aldolase (KDO 8-P synthase)